MSPTKTLAAIEIGPPNQREISAKNVLQLQIVNRMRGLAVIFHNTASLLKSSPKGEGFISHSPKETIN